MQRRAFLKSAALAATASVAGMLASEGESGAAADITAATAPASASGGGGGGAPAQLFEFRTYHFASPEKRAAYEAFVAEVAVPAWNRAGIRPVGAFKLLAADNPEMKLPGDPNDLWVLLPHPSPGSLLELESKLAADEAYQSGGRAILAAPKADAAFTRYESLLLRPTPGRPTVTVAPRDPQSVFEVRTYESANVERHLNKLEMFDAGEFPAFDRSGMTTIFFGAAVAGPDLPQLTYMNLHRDSSEVKKHWDAFGQDAAWKKLRGDPKYKDNVSKITKRFYRAAAGSQI